QRCIQLVHHSYLKTPRTDARPAADALALALAAMTGMVRDMGPNSDVLRAAAGAGFATATDLADWCVRVLGIPFRDAHHITGSLVKLAEDRGVDLAALPLADMQAVEPRITDDVYSVLTVEASVASRTSYGGAAPDQVRAQIARWKALLS
ncbi:MAG: argininosuccinate lyase, partial [Pseudomonadota bacterium]